MRKSDCIGVPPRANAAHRTADMWYAESRLVCCGGEVVSILNSQMLQGPERIKGAYAYRTLLEHSRSGVLPLGSDFPVEDINPLFGFYAAVARLNHKGDSPHGNSGWYVSSLLCPS